MSFEIKIAGHSSAPHNQQVKEVAEDAVAKLKAALPGSTVSLSGYSWDNTERIDLALPAEKGEKV